MKAKTRKRLIVTIVIVVFHVLGFLSSIHAVMGNKVERMFVEDFERSRLKQPGDYDERSFWFKLAVRLARFSAPVQ